MNKQVKQWYEKTKKAVFVTIFFLYMTLLFTKGAPALYKTAYQNILLSIILAIIWTAIGSSLYYKEDLKKLFLLLCWSRQGKIFPIPTLAVTFFGPLALLAQFVYLNCLAFSGSIEKPSHFLLHFLAVSTFCFWISKLNYEIALINGGTHFFYDGIALLLAPIEKKDRNLFEIQLAERNLSAKYHWRAATSFSIQLYLDNEWLEKWIKEDNAKCLDISSKTIEQNIIDNLLELFATKLPINKNSLDEQEVQKIVAEIKKEFSMGLNLRLHIQRMDELS